MKTLGMKLFPDCLVQVLSQSRMWASSASCSVVLWSFLFQGSNLTQCWKKSREKCSRTVNEYVNGRMLPQCTLDCGLQHSLKTIFCHKKIHPRISMEEGESWLLNVALWPPHVCYGMLLSLTWTKLCIKEWWKSFLTRYGNIPIILTPQEAEAGGSLGTRNLGPAWATEKTSMKRVQDDFWVDD